MPHFEIHATDVDRAKTFYSGLFGWSFEPMQGGEDIKYHLIEGVDIGIEKGVSGGILQRADATPAPGGPVRGGTMTFDVENCDERYAWALANGGADAMPPQDFPGVGRCAYVEDSEGNIVGMITSVEGGA